MEKHKSLYLISLILFSPISIPIILRIKIIDFIFQPVLYKIMEYRWYKLCEHKKGILIDYPPKFGKISIMDLFEALFYHSTDIDDSDDIV